MGIMMFLGGPSKNVLKFILKKRLNRKMYKTFDIGGKKVKEAWLKKPRSPNGLLFSSLPNSRLDINVDEYADHLKDATIATTLTYSGTTYNVYDTFTNGRWTGTSAGNVRPWFLTPHLMIGAHHYANKVVGNLKIDDTLTVNRLRWVNLKEWALQNGFTEDRFPANSFLDDIDIIELDKSTGLDQLECPYLASTKWIHDNFWFHNTNYTIGYSSSQATNYAIPIIFKSNDYGYPRADWTNANTLVDKLGTPFTNCSALTDPQYPRYEGDSGKPKYILYNNKPIVISQCYGVDTGPDFSKVIDILHAYAVQYGDYINEIVTPSRIVPLALWWDDYEDEPLTEDDIVREQSDEFENYDNKYYARFASNGIYIKCTEKSNSGVVIWNQTKGTTVSNINEELFFAIGDKGYVSDGDDDKDFICVLSNIEIPNQTI